MIGEICAEIRNYFCMEGDILIGDYAIQDGTLVPSVDLAEGQYFRIVGSIFNDGVHNSNDELTDEGTFHGAIWKMRVPQDIIRLAEDIEAWQSQYSDVISSPYASESFGGYSYSKGSGSDGSIGINWRNQSDFVARMKPYRRIRVL